MIMYGKFHPAALWHNWPWAAGAEDEVTGEGR